MSDAPGRTARIGVGMEIGATLVRGVRLDLERPDDLVAAEFPVESSDERSLRDAMVRVSGAVAPADAPPAPSRIAVAPPQLLIQAVDVTGMSRHELLRIADDAFRRKAADTMTVVDDGVRRRLVLVRWQRAQPDQIAALARQAGLHDVSVEPAPLALARVIGGDRHIVRRVAEPGVSWLALFDHGLPVLAASVATDLDGPTVTINGASRADHDPERLVGGDELLRWLLGADAAADAAESATSPALRVLDRALPAYPAHDLRASDRVAVALGAAVGAAGATERQREIEPLASLRPTAEVATAARQPWAVERIERDVPAEGRTGLLTRRSRRTRRGSATSRRYRRRR